MSSELYYINFLVSIQTYLFQIGGPILIVFGSISCIIGLVVFTRKNLRKNPCSIYLIAFNSGNFLLIYTSLLFTTLIFGYDFYNLLTNLQFCRFYFYIVILSDILPPSYLILASIDRILITSPNASTRRKSTRRLTYVCIITVTLFWMLAHSYGFIIPKLAEVVPNYFICYLEPNLLEGTAYYSLIIKGILVPVLMIVFGLWPIRNIRRIRRIRPDTMVFSKSGLPRGDFNSVNSKEMQLIRIMVINISVYLIFSLMISLVLTQQQITKHNEKSQLQTQIDTFLVNVARFIDFIPFCVASYTNLVVSKTFRNEVKTFLFCH